MAHLRQLKDATRNVPVTIIVQEIVDDKNLPYAHRLERYIFKDGEQEKVADIPATNIADDLKDFVDYAVKNHPAEHLGLTILSHGTGDAGIEGDSWHADISMVAAAIKDGLVKNNITKLNVLDFDACLMAQVGVLKEMAPLAHHLIASADIEDTDNYKASVDGQNLNGWLMTLLKHPDMTPEALSRAAITIADETNKAAPDLKDGSKTLAHFDLDKYAQFEKSFDHFGATVSQSIKSTQDKKTVQDTIELSPKSNYWALSAKPQETWQYSSVLQNERRDLRSFVEAIDQQVKAGKLSDADGKIAKSSLEMRTALAALEPEFHNSNRPGDGYSSGLTVFLPKSELLNTRALSQRLSPFGRAGQLLNPQENINNRRDLEPLLATEVNTAVDLLHKDARGRKGCFERAI